MATGEIDIPTSWKCVRCWGHECTIEGVEDTGRMRVRCDRCGQSQRVIPPAETAPWKTRS